ncbi:MAG TPA: AraC family transcriptional regulator ligand-binding domain-containing protein [Polyangiales bacterium]|nr:AraC family transcriptional regulator ligand-binding domain-containing protein [Polyangiales bacterium]
MQLAPSPGQPCYSARLLAPFVGVLREHSTFPEESLRWIATLDPDTRVHVSAVNTLLDAALQLTGDPLLGLKATERFAAGDVGILDFILSSAESVRAALQSAGRYMRLINDSSLWTLELDGELVRVRLESSVKLAAAAEDFGLIGFIRNQSPNWPEGMVEELDVWLSHPAPDDAQPYIERLAPARLHFGAPLTGFGFPARFLDQPLRKADPRLHDVLRRYGESTLAALPQAESVTEKVRGFVVERLASGSFSLDDAARRLCMSSRTLGRRLADEHTTFKELVDEVRRSVALRMVAGHDLGLSEVALLAGFTETPSFYRAFRRWTGVTPSQYRMAHRGDLRGLR